MRKWFRVGLVALAVALGVWAYTLQPPEDVAVPPTAKATAGDIAAGVLTNALRNGGAPSDVEMPWRVTQANSTVDVMVVDVEAERPEDALAIAEDVVAPLADSYVEVVIYVRGRNQTDDDSVRRVQWTPDTGYVETTYSDR